MEFTKAIEISYRGMVLIAFPLYEDNTWTVTAGFHLPTGSIIRLIEEEPRPHAS